MGLFSSRPGKIVKKVTTASWQVGTKTVLFAGEKAGKGSVWVIKKAAVDPVKRKVLNWSLVSALGKARAKNGQCAGCGKTLGMFAGKADICSTSCALGVYESWSEAKQERVNNFAGTGRKMSNPNGLYLDCGCNKNWLSHSGSCSQFAYMDY